MILKFLINVIFPPVCSFCKKEGDFLCGKCISELRTRPISPVSHTPSASEFNYLDGVIYGVDYAVNPAIQSAVRQFKYRFTQELVAHFGSLAAAKLSQLKMTQNKTSVLIPVPLHRKRLNYRGFNQAELIARSIAAQYSGGAEIRSLLRRIRHTSQQARLSKWERHQNLHSAFEVIDFEPSERDCKDRIYFVVDDVCTTGATLDSCAQALKAAGVKKVYGLVVARAFK
jgi:ComF family protein